METVLTSFIHIILKKLRTIRFKNKFERFKKSKNKTYGPLIRSVPLHHLSPFGIFLAIFWLSFPSQFFCPFHRFYSSQPFFFTTYLVISIAAIHHLHRKRENTGGNSSVSEFFRRLNHSDKNNFKNLRI